jgi:AcrR family transcriptional regulator
MAKQAKKLPGSAASPDFRTRTARVRREKTRRRILEAAFSLFDERGVNRVSVDDVREAAGLSRGSFYNYFSTYESMLIEIAATIATQINQEQSEYFGAIPDLAERICQNIRYFITRASSDRACSGILIRVLPLVGPPNVSMRQHAEAEFTEAATRGMVNVPSISVALDMGYGIVTAMIGRAMSQKADDGEIGLAGFMLLRAFGISDSVAKKISRKRLPAPPNIPLRESIIQAAFSP